MACCCGQTEDQYDVEEEEQVVLIDGWCCSCSANVEDCVEPGPEPILKSALASSSLRSVACPPITHFDGSQELIIKSVCDQQVDESGDVFQYLERYFAEASDRVAIVSMLLLHISIL